MNTPACVGPSLGCEDPQGFFFHSTAPSRSGYAALFCLIAVGFLRQGLLFWLFKGNRWAPLKGIQIEM